MKKWLIAALPLVAILSTAALSTAGVKNFLAVINGAQEIPPNPSTATGIAHFSYDTATKNLCFEVTHTVAGEAAAHIHGPDLPPGNGGAGAGIAGVGAVAAGALVKIQAAGVADDDGRVDVKAQVPEHAQVQANVEDVAA